MKKVLSLFLSVVMLLSVTAGLSFTAQATDKISVIEVNSVAAPYKGAKIADLKWFSTPDWADYTGVSSSIANCITWYDLDSDSPADALEDNAVCQQGHTYKVGIALIAKSGCAFDENAKAYVNGKAATSGQHNGYALTARRVVYYTFPAITGDNRVDKINISGSIKDGDTLSKNLFTVSDSAVDSFEAVGYARNGNGVDIGSTASYGTYSVTFYVKLKDGYCLDKITRFSAAYYGATAYATVVGGDSDVALVTFEGLETVCNHLSISDWKKNADGHWKTCNSCGEPVTSAGHTFGAKVVNGNYDTYTCTVCGFVKKVANTNVSIFYYHLKDSVVPCVDGGTIGDISVDCFRDNDEVLRDKYDGVTVQSCEWYKGSVSASNKMAAGSKFVAGNTYYAVLTIKSDSHYYVDAASLPDAQSEVLGGWISSYGGTREKVDENTAKITVKYTAIEKQNVTLTMPTVNIGMTYKEALDTIVCKTNGVNSNFTVQINNNKGNIYSVYKENGEWKTYGSTPIYDILNMTFEANTNYTIDVTKNSADFTYKNDITFDGANAATSSYDGDSIFVLGHGTYTLGSNTIYEIQLDDIEAPVPGNTSSPLFTVKNKYGVNAGALSWDSATFECGKEYTATLTVSAATGFTFSPLTYAVVQGADDITTVISGNTAIITLKYKTQPHNFDYDAGVAVHPTCTEQGSITYTCLICGETDVHYVKATGHMYVDQITTAPTFKKAGVRTYTCVDGDSTYTKAVPKLKNTKVKKVTAGKKKMTVTVAKSTGVDGYQIQYSTSKKFKKGKNTKTVKLTKAKTVKKTIKKLKSGKNYYIRVRAYKKIGNKTVYAGWVKYKKAAQIK